jgi:hypothetical protein
MRELVIGLIAFPDPLGLQGQCVIAFPNALGLGESGLFFFSRLLAGELL